MSDTALSGLRVVDFSRVLAGPYCTMLLADFGADVIKIENPSGGDDTRQWGPPWLENQSAYYSSIHRNKRSLALDLKQPKGQGQYLDVARFVSHSEWVAALSQCIPAGTIDAIPAALSHPQAVARQRVQEARRPDGRSVRPVSPVAKLSQTPARISSLPPALGEHAGEILQQVLGFSPAEIEGLAKENVIAFPKSQEA